MASSSSSSSGGEHARRRRPVRVLAFLLRGEQRIRRVKNYREKMEPFNEKFYKWKKKTKQEFCQRCNFMFRSLGQKIRLELYSFHTNWKFRIVSVRLQQEEGGDHEDAVASEQEQEEEGDHEDAVASEHEEEQEQEEGEDHEDAVASEHEEEEEQEQEQERLKNREDPYEDDVVAEHEQEQERHQNLGDPYEDVVVAEHEHEQEQEQEQKRHEDLWFDNYWDPNQNPNEDEEDDGNPNEDEEDDGNPNEDEEDQSHEPRRRDPNSGKQNRDGEHEDNREKDPNSVEYEEEQQDPNDDRNMDGDGDKEDEIDERRRRSPNSREEHRDPELDPIDDRNRDGDGDKEDEIDERRRRNPNSREDEEEHRVRHQVGHGSGSQSNDEYLRLSYQLRKAENAINRRKRMIAMTRKQAFADIGDFATLAKISALFRLLLLELPIQRFPLVLTQFEERINKEMRESFGKNVLKHNVPTAVVSSFLVSLFKDMVRGLELQIDAGVCYISVKHGRISKQTGKFKYLKKLIDELDSFQLRKDELDQQLEAMQRR